MPLSPELDQKIRKRFDELIEEANNLIRKMLAHDAQAAERHQQWQDENPRVFLPHSASYGYLPEFRAIVVKAMNLVEHVFANTERALDVTKDIRDDLHERDRVYTLRLLVGTLGGLKDIYENGFLDDLETRVVANISSEYMAQVDEILTTGLSDTYDHIFAAIMCGAVLEDALRRLCDRQAPQVPTDKPNGQPKALNALIQDLQKANAFNKPKAGQLRGWAQVRNSAAHGKFDEFNRDDVELMVKGVKNFLADYL